MAGNLGISANIFLGREVKTKYLGGLVHTLNENLMNTASKKVLDALDIRFANFSEKIEKLSAASGKRSQLPGRCIGRRS